MHLSLLLPAAALLPQALGQLDTLAKAKGWKYFGSATDNGELSDAPYVEILSKNTEFGQITPGNSQKWDATEPDQGTFTFEKGDVIAAFAAENKQMLRCHALVWHSQLPSWVTGGSWTNETLTAVMKNHIKEVMTHYKGQCYAWDVVNEAFEENGTYRDSIFHKIIGPEFIPIAFAEAALHDNQTKLYYNDYNIENAGGKSTAALNIVKDLKARGIKIDGVGMQAHFIVGSTPDLKSQTANLEAFVKEGVEVAYTELDIRHASLPPSPAALTTQSDDYVSTINACLAVAQCVGVTIWDYTDKYSWVPSTFPGTGDALLYDKDLKPKAAYQAVVAALGGSSGSVAEPALVGAPEVTPVPAPVPVPTTLSTRPVATPTPTPAAGGGAVGTVAFWGQCGGSGFKGSTTCAEGSTCVVQNPYYSQCM
ncbi:hypothetical protein HYFRA_00000637 [Hymenoscyphus fraxineus]|uniref:Beta-xylanase n=1 Tax=Hymenoscyphus fraxineus TaxID=746836 RepID=A0A9N9PY35_9HELO|nr:hypothetical protein HYFRA_00000637 [Hymenoscyphus fraxineus]